MLFPSVVGDCSEVFRVLVHAANGRAFGVILVGKSGWKVHGTRLSCGSNGIPQKVILFFPDGMFQMIPFSGFRVRFFRKWN